MMVSRSPGLISSQGGRDNWCHSERRCDCDGLDDYGKGISHMKTADAKQTHKLGPAYFSLCPGVSCDQCIISDPIHRIVWPSPSPLSNVTCGKASLLTFYLGVQWQRSIMYWVSLSAKYNMKSIPSSYDSFILTQ